MKGIGLKYNIEKSLLGQTKIYIFGLWVTHDGVNPIDKKYKQ